MVAAKPAWWVYLLAVIFIFFSVIYLQQDIYYLLLIPIIFLEIALLVYRIDLLLLTIFLTTPFSITLYLRDFGLNVPSELLLIPLLGVFLFKLLQREFDPKIFRHPISICILLQLGWIL